MHDNRAQFLKFHIRGSFFSVYCHVIFLHCVKSARIHSCYKSSSADGLYRVETCTDPCGPNRSDEAASTAADDDLYRVETSTDPCGPNQPDEAASTAADDDLCIGNIVY